MKLRAALHRIADVWAGTPEKDRLEKATEAAALELGLAPGDIHLVEHEEAGTLGIELNVPLP